MEAARGDEVPYMPYSPKRLPCETCNGSGEVMYRSGDMEGELPCEDCCGTGESEDYECPCCLGSGEYRPGLERATSPNIGICKFCEGNGWVTSAKAAEWEEMV